jgi:hypothetical protein
LAALSFFSWAGTLGATVGTPKLISRLRAITCARFSNWFAAVAGQLNRVLADVRWPKPKTQYSEQVAQRKGIHNLRQSVRRVVGGRK